MRILRFFVVFSALVKTLIALTSFQETVPKPLLSPNAHVRRELFVKNKSTLLEYIALEQLTDNAGHFENLDTVFSAIQKATKTIAHGIRVSAIGKKYREQAERVVTYNLSGDAQKDIDVVSNEVITSALLNCGQVRLIASEEDDDMVLGSEAGKYVVVFDPLDGSSNVEASIPTGTIFGVYRFNPSVSMIESVLQPGSSLVAAGYVLYGASTMMTISLGKGTHLFELDKDIGEFVCIEKDIRIPQRGRTYSLNESRWSDWPDGLKRYVTALKRGDSDAKHRYNLIYICSFVADVHHVLLHGGIASNPRNHLRLVYEGNPIALLIEQAGGKASTGVGPIMDVNPTFIHQRIPIFVGSKDDVEELERYGTQYGGVQQLGNKKYEI